MAKRKAEVKPATERRGRAVALAGLVPPLARKAYRARGFAQATVISRWPEIVGRALADVTLPLRLRFRRGERTDGMLEIRIESAFAAELQHREPEILARINAFFGYRAVARLRLVHGSTASPPPRPQAAAPSVVPDSRSRTEAERLAKPVGDVTLRDILKRWGAEILASARDKTERADSDSPSPPASG
ncbi:MAG: DUF721 domain-containing protein [Rhodothalassiaceae bacterium]